MDCLLVFLMGIKCGGSIVLINFIHSSSHPQSLLFSSDVSNVSLGTIEPFPLFDHTEYRLTQK